MNKIFEGESVLEKIKSERILGKEFWIILLFFVALLATILILSNMGVQPDSQISEFILEMNGEVSAYQSEFEKTGTIPLSIAGILAASSLLLFIERIIISNSKMFALHLFVLF